MPTPVQGHEKGPQWAEAAEQMKASTVLLMNEQKRQP